MKTKQFIDQLYRAINGAFSRSELLQRLNSAQNELFSDNVLEMRELDTVTVEQTPTQPVFLAITLSKEGAAGAASYAINDAITVTVGGIVLYFRVVVPFDNAVGVQSTNIAGCCVPISASDYATGAIATKIHGAGVVFAAGDYLWDPTDGGFYCCTEGFTASADLADDIANHGVYPAEDKPTSGTEPATGATYPTYVEVEGLREVTTVGVLDTDGTFRETYTPRIVQSKNPGQPVRIYVDDDLPKDTALDIEGWRWPTQILSENTDMEIPEIHQNGLVRTIILASVEEEAYGSVNPERVQREKDQRKSWYDYVNRDKKRPPTSRKITFNPLAG